MHFKIQAFYFLNYTQNHKLESYRTAISRSVFTEACSFTNFSAHEEIKQRIETLRSNFPITINRSRKKTGNRSEIRIKTCG